MFIFRDQILKYLFTVPLLLFILLLNLIINCQNKGDHEYMQSVKQWHENRIAALTRPDGWLSLIGLFWLKPGENTFGGAKSNAINFPTDKVPAEMGVFIFKDEQVQAVIRKGVAVYHNGQPVDTLLMKNDIEGEPTILTYGTLSWYVIKRGEKFGIRLKDSESKALQDFSGIKMFKIDSRWRSVAKFKPYNPPKTIEIPTVLGTIEEDTSPGALEFTLFGQTYSLDPTGNAEDKRWFIIFADVTNGEQTYGAGRFLYVDAPGENGTTIIDFNKAYNPPCAFSPYATCPLPPEENYLPIPVTAGEEKYQGYEHEDSGAAIP
jgi:uncharacterized protein (DUF1684 family)